MEKPKTEDFDFSSPKVTFYIVLLGLILVFAVLPTFFEPACVERPVDSSSSIERGTVIRVTDLAPLTQSRFRIITESAVAPDVCGIVRLNSINEIAGEDHYFVKFTNTLRTPRGWIARSDFVVIGQQTSFELFLYTIIPYLSILLLVIALIWFVFIVFYDDKIKKTYKHNIGLNLDANRRAAIKRLKVKLKEKFEDINTNQLTSINASDWIQAMLQADSLLYESLKLLYPKYEQLTLGDLLKKLVKKEKKDNTLFLEILKGVQSAHYVRNTVAHASGDEQISKQKIKKAIHSIERFLKHTEFLED